VLKTVFRAWSPARLAGRFDIDRYQWVLCPPKKERPEQSAEMNAATELVPTAKEQGLTLTGPNGLLKQLTKTVIQTPYE